MFTVNIGTPESFYIANVRPLVAGDIFYYDGMQFETLLSILNRYTNSMEVRSIEPGNDLYTDFGTNAVVVVTAHVDVVTEEPLLP